MRGGRGATSQVRLVDDPLAVWSGVEPRMYPVGWDAHICTRGWDTTHGYRHSHTPRELDRLAPEAHMRPLARDSATDRPRNLVCRNRWVRRRVARRGSESPPRPAVIGHRAADKPLLGSRHQIRLSIAAGISGRDATADALGAPVACDQRSRRLPQFCAPPVADHASLATRGFGGATHGVIPLLGFTSGRPPAPPCCRPMRCIRRRPGGCLTPATS